MHSADKFFNRWVRPECLSAGHHGDGDDQQVISLVLSGPFQVRGPGDMAGGSVITLAPLESFQQVDILQMTGVRSSTPQRDRTWAGGEGESSPCLVQPTPHSRPLTQPTPIVDP